MISTSKSIDPFEALSLINRLLQWRKYLECRDTCIGQPLNCQRFIFEIFQPAQQIMSQRKPWTNQQDQLLRRLTIENEDKQQEKLKWGEIAEKMAELGTRRSGKQCRQRWHNQLKPGIQNERQWQVAEEQKLFRLQERLGNKWANIAKQLPGRTDNNIKNYFYSTLRKALRKVNGYVSFHKRENPYKNVKEFRQQTLSKILTVAEHKFQNKVNLKKKGVEEDAREIKKLLVEIQRDDDLVPSAEHSPLLERAVNRILEFNRNCKRRKGKRKDSDNEEEPDQIISEEEHVFAPSPEVVRPQRRAKRVAQDKVKIENKSVKNNVVQTKQIEHQLCARPSQSRQSDLWASGLGLVKKSSSGPPRDYPQLFASSSFRQYSGIQGFTLGDSRIYNGINNMNTMPQGGFLANIPQYEPTLQHKYTGKSDNEFWKEDPSPPNHPMMNLMDRSLKYDDPLRMSVSLGASALLQKRTSSRLEKKQSQGPKMK